MIRSGHLQSTGLLSFSLAAWCGDLQALKSEWSYMTPNALTWGQLPLNSTKLLSVELYTKLINCVVLFLCQISPAWYWMFLLRPDVIRQHKIPIPVLTSDGSARMATPSGPGKPSVLVQKTKPNISTQSPPSPTAVIPTQYGVTSGFDKVGDTENYPTLLSKILKNIQWQNCHVSAAIWLYMFQPVYCHLQV